MTQSLFLHQAQVICGDDGIWPGLTVEVDTLSINDANIVAGIAGPLGHAKTLKDLYALLNVPAQAGEAATAASTITGSGDAARGLPDVVTSLGSPAQTGEAATAAATITGSGGAAKSLPDVVSALAPLQAPAALGSGTKTVSTPGEPVPLADAATPCRGVIVRGLLKDDGTASNTKAVKIGITGGVEFRIGPNDPPLLVPISDAANLLVDAIEEDEGVQFIILGV